MFSFLIRALDQFYLQFNMSLRVSDEPRFEEVTKRNPSPIPMEQMCEGLVARPGVYWDEDVKRYLVDIESTKGTHGFLRLPSWADGDEMRQILEESYKCKHKVVVIYGITTNEISSVRN